MKKIFVLIISILLPIIAGAAVAAYGYNVRYVPETNSAIAGEFVRDMNKGIITSEERIANYRKLENYYYEEEPIFKKDILNNEGERLFTLAIYRNLCIYQPSSDVEAKLKTLFEVFAYNINYTKVKEYFVLDNMSIIEDAGMPSLKVTFTGTNDKATFSVNLTNRSNVVIPDYSSVPEFADEETETRNYVQSEVFREYESYTNMNKFTNDVNVKVEAYLTIKNDDSTTTTIEAEKPLAEEYVVDFKHKGEEINKDDLQIGYRDASVNKTYKNAGFNGWLFKKYVWWQALIGFGLAGLVTGSFVLMYLSEEAQAQQKANKKKKK